MIHVNHGCQHFQPCGAVVFVVFIHGMTTVNISTNTQIPALENDIIPAILLHFTVTKNNNHMALSQSLCRCNVSTHHVLFVHHMGPSCIHHFVMSIMWIPTYRKHYNVTFSTTTIGSYPFCPIWMHLRENCTNDKQLTGIFVQDEGLSIRWETWICEYRSIK